MLGNKELSYQPSNDDYDRIRSQGVMRIAALAERLNSNPKIDSGIFKERMGEIVKNYLLTEEDASEVLSDVTMAMKKGKSAYDYLKGGQPAFSPRIGNWLKYLKGVDVREYESALREMHLGEDTRKNLLSNPYGMVQDYAPGERERIIASGKRPSMSERDVADGNKPRVVF